MYGAQDYKKKLDYATKLREKSHNANIYVRKYMPDRERAEMSEMLTKQAKLKSLFDEKDPNKKYFLRPK